MNWSPAKKPRRRKKPKNETEDESDPEIMPCVRYLPIQCPRCKVKEGIKNTGRHPSGTLRYHLCGSCGLRFKSKEVGA